MHDPPHELRCLLLVVVVTRGREREELLTLLVREVLERVDIGAPGISFPNEDLDEDLIELIGPIPQARGRSPGKGVGFMTSEGGRHLLIASQSVGTAFLNENLERVETTPTTAPIGDYMVLPTDEGDQQLLAVVEGRWDSPLSGTSELRSYSMDGTELWRFGVEGQSIESMATLYHAGEVFGVVLGIGGESGVVTLDLNGTKLWDLPNRHVVYEVRTHPDLHSRVVRCGWGIEIVDARGKPLERDMNVAERLARKLMRGGSRDYVMGTGDGRLYPSHAQVFPDSENRAAIVVAGSGNNGVETIARWDEEGKTVWHATVPTDVNGLCLIEPPDGDRLFAAITRDGELYVFDQNGILRHRRNILAPGAKMLGSTSHLSVYGMKSGQVDDSTVFTISLVDKTLVYKVNP